MRKIFYSFFILLLIGACAQKVEDQTDIPKTLKKELSKLTTSDPKVVSRLNYFDNHFFKQDPDLNLTDEQREKLYPVIQKKLAALKTKLAQAQNKSERQQIRKTIRQEWNAAIEAHLTPAQIKARQAKLKID